MYHPTTRLLAVLELLQSRVQMSGAEIAARLEVDIRTVRRYIVMLQDMGIPVEGQRGRNGTYQIQRGFKLPPLMFTEDEAVMLTLGLLAIREQSFSTHLAVVESALAKIERVLPDASYTKTKTLRDAIVYSFLHPVTPFQGNLIATLSASVQNRQQVHLRYGSPDGSQTERAFDPYGVIVHEWYWYVVGFCHLRQGPRTFRVDRITEVAPLNVQFEKPADFDPLSYLLDSLEAALSTYQVEVLLKTSMDTAREIVPPSMGTLHPVENGVLFQRQGHSLDWIAQFLLSLPVPIVIQQPDELRAAFKRLAERAFNIASADCAEQPLNSALNG